MGACVSKGVTYEDNNDLPNQDSESSLTDASAIDASEMQDVVNGHGERSPISPKDKMVGNGLDGDSFTKKTPFKTTSVDNRSQNALRKSAEFWKHGDAVHSMPSEELVVHYHEDAELILNALGRLEHAFQAKEMMHPSATTAGRGLATERASVSLRGVSEDPHLHARASLSARTALSSQVSEAVSLCDDEGLVPGLPNQSLKVLLTADPLIVGAKQDIDDGRMLTARKKLRSWCKRHGLKISELDSHSMQLGIDVAALQTDCKTIEKAIETQRNEDGFRVARDDGELRVLYKAANHGKHHCVKMEATLPFPLERPLSLAREFDLMKTWNKYMTESELLSAPSIWESFVYACMWMPFPFPQMECLGKGRGFDLSEEYKCLMISCESCEASDLPKGSKPLPKLKKKHHRAQIMPGSSIRLEPLPPLPGDLARTKGSIVMIIDPHVPRVPEFIVNWVLGVMAPFAHRQIKKLLQTDYDNPDKPFPKRMAEQPELYERVRDQVRQGLEKHYGKEVAQQVISKK